VAMSRRCCKECAAMHCGKVAVGAKLPMQHVELLPTPQLPVPAYEAAVPNQTPLSSRSGCSMIAATEHLPLCCAALSIAAVAHEAACSVQTCCTPRLACAWLCKLLHKPPAAVEAHGSSRVATTKHLRSCNVLRCAVQDSMHGCMQPTTQHSWACCCWPRVLLLLLPPQNSHAQECRKVHGGSTERVVIIIIAIFVLV
jgi:hypothetical protein